MTTVPKITDQELEKFAQWILQQSNIVLDKSKAYLLETRLSPLLKEFGVTGYADLYSRLNMDRRLQTAVVDAVSTNETSFFRDIKPFDLLKHKLIPELLEKDMKRRVRIWSSASSTGQEAYSITMLLKDILFDLTKYNIQIVGTDISDFAVTYASKAHFSILEASRGLTSVQLAKFFDQVNGRFQIKDELRSIVTFKKFNLFTPMNAMGQFDIIFCRNVAIYFSKEDRSKLFNNLADRLPMGGKLIIGSTESLIGISDRFQRQDFHGAVYYERIR